MGRAIETDVCVIGGGSGGLSVAAGAAQMGADTVLVERGLMGGDCLNFGCVPSKALLAAAHAAEAVRRAKDFGVSVPPPNVNFAAVHDHVHDVIAQIAPHDSIERFEGLGVTVIQGSAAFLDRRRIVVGDDTVRARRFVIATGSTAAIPPVPGLDRVPYLTNETVFALKSLPSHLLVLGGGPIGVELAQAFRNLGSQVTVIEMQRVLGRDDPELAEIVKNRLSREGVELMENAQVQEVETDGDGLLVRVSCNGSAATVAGSHLLVAAGRRPNIGDLRLEAANISASPGGIQVNRRLRTTNRRVYAVGDVAGPFQFTHMAGYQAGIVIRNILFRIPAKVDYRAVPWVTYTDPELAQVGMDEASARKTHGDIRVLRAPFAENDRARAERRAEGLVKIITTPKGIVVGATMAGPHAGEVVQGWVLPIARRMHIKHLAGLILPYPTLGEIGKRAAGSYFTEALFGRRVRRLVRFLSRFG